MGRRTSAVFARDVAAGAAGVVGELTPVALPAGSNFSAQVVGNGMQTDFDGQLVAVAVDCNLDSAVALDTAAGTEAWDQAVKNVYLVVKVGGRTILAGRLASLGKLVGMPSSGGGATSIGFRVAGTHLFPVAWDAPKGSVITVEAHRIATTGVAVQGVQVEVFGEF